MLIGVIISGIIEEYTSVLCKGIENLAREDGVQVVIIPGKYINMDYGADLSNKYGYCFNSSFSFGQLSCFDGLIIEMASVGMFATDEQKKAFASSFKDTPHVFISYDGEVKNNVFIDNKAGLTEALQYMYDNGARKYAMLGGPHFNKDAVERQQTFYDFVKSHGLELNDNSYEEGDFFLDCSEQANRLIDNNLDADVFVCANDIIANHIYNGLKRHNLVPGKDVSVLGFDDSDFATTMYPLLSSIRMDFMKLGENAYRELKNLLDGKNSTNSIVPSEFILRDSIKHKDETEQKAKDIRSFSNVTKANTRVVSDVGYVEAKSIFKQLIEYVDNYEQYSPDVLVENICTTAQNLLTSKGAKFIELNLLMDNLETLFKEKFSDVMDKEKRAALSVAYYEMLKSIILLFKSKSTGSRVLNYKDIHQSEAFFRDTMQFTRNMDKNYEKIFRDVEFLGINNACLFLYEEPVSYIQDETFEIPKYMYIKSVLQDGNIISIHRNQQKILSENIFLNPFLKWDTYNRLVIFPIYSEQYLYGLTVCDMKYEEFESSEIFVNQINSIVKMIKLQIDNTKMLNDYEESMRKLKENNIVLDNMSKSDPLTGLNNRRGLGIRIDDLLEKYPNSSKDLAFGYTDMNNLKIINDRFGHDDGDFALRTIGRILYDFVKEYDGFTARIGGDEFAFVFPCEKTFDIDGFRRTLYTAFDEYNNYSSKAYNISVSAGIYIKKVGDAISSDDAFNLADEQLYTEKLKKKNDVIKAGF